MLAYHQRCFSLSTNPDSRRLVMIRLIASVREEPSRVAIPYPFESSSEPTFIVSQGDRSLTYSLFVDLKTNEYE